MTDEAAHESEEPLDDVYTHRFSDVDAENKDALWRPIARFIQRWIDASHQFSMSSATAVTSSGMFALRSAGRPTCATSGSTSLREFASYRPQAPRSMLSWLGFEPSVRFLPFTTKSRVPQFSWLVASYLRFPPAWRVMGEPEPLRRPARLAASAAEAVPDPGNRVDICRLLCVRLDLATQAVDVCVHRACLDLDLVPPDATQQLAAAHHLPWA